MLMVVSVQIVFRLNTQLSSESVCLSDFTKFTSTLKSILTGHLCFSNVIMDVRV